MRSRCTGQRRERSRTRFQGQSTFRCGAPGQHNATGSSSTTGDHGTGAGQCGGVDELAWTSEAAAKAEGQVLESISGQRWPGNRSVSFLVSFSYARPGSPGHSRPCHRRSQTATTHGERGPTDLESVWGTAVAHDRLASDRVTNWMTIAIEGGGRQRTGTDGPPQARRAATQTARAATWLRDEEASSSAQAARHSAIPACPGCPLRVLVRPSSRPSLLPN